MAGPYNVREDQARAVAGAVVEAMRLIASGAPRTQLRTLLLGLRVPGERGLLGLGPDHAALLASQLPYWTAKPRGDELAGQAITLFLDRRTAP